MTKNKNESDLEQLRKQKFSTHRVTVQRLEKLIYKKFKVLDKGFVRLIDYMGDDTSIVQAARVSYGKGTKKVNQDKNLINYLLKYKHSTPFEMNEIKLHIKLPIFIARQWIRHRTANVNEYSARYSVLEKEFYIPEQENVKTQSKSNNQGREKKLQKENIKKTLKILKKHSKDSFLNYSYLLNEDESGNILDEGNEGLARELARMVLPLNTYTQWYWKIDLHNLMHFLSLRFDSHAQFEIRVYAEAILKIMKQWVPLTYDAFMRHRMHGFSISEDGVRYVKKLIDGKDTGKVNISRREEHEIIRKFSLKN
tara:strand:- start:1296 stop:2225 length:930 start_codon:yes stop_codon:yes gene_type:complete